MSGSPVHRLVLSPCEPHYAPGSWNAVREALLEAQIIDAPISKDEDNLFLIGEKFLQYITFLGCSPHIELVPPKDGSLDFCHIQLNPIYATPVFRHATNNVFARCPQCGKRIQAWQQAVSQWRNNPQSQQLVCEKCHAKVSLYQLSWRHTAAFARLFIDIFSIYPQEAIPTEQLMQVLENATDKKWDYFYTDR